MSQSSDNDVRFVYASYVRAAPEQVWGGLTDPSMTRRYWRHERAGPKTFRSQWTAGSTWDLEHRAVGLMEGGVSSSSPNSMKAPW